MQFALLAFGENALRHFVYFERPQGVDLKDASASRRSGPGPAPMASRELQPRGQDFDTQGDLYRAMEDGLVSWRQLWAGRAVHRPAVGPGRARVSGGPSWSR